MKRALITGGSGVLGGAICRALAAGGLHVIVHAYRRPEDARRVAQEHGKPGTVMIAGVVGRTEQAVREATMARDLGYHAVLMSMAAFKGAAEDELIAHARKVADVMPLVGFYLQPAVGGIVLPVSFWRRFAEIENVAAIKIAPFNRYRTIDVLRGVAEAGADG